MKYWRGYLVAAILAAMTWVLMAMGQRFSTLVDMVYPYVMRTVQSMLTQWSGGADFLLWQVIAVVLLVVLLATVVLMIILKWNPIQWFGWVLTGVCGIYLLYTLVYGLNYYAGPLAEDIKLEMGTYNVEELTEAAIYYRDKANELSAQVNRDSQGNVKYPGFETLARQAGNGFEVLTYARSYPIFAGSTDPVKKLAWADWYTRRGITGVTMGLTGESAVNPQIPPICLPFSMCHEMAHRMCIANERDANFAAFLACSANESVDFRYSAYFMAYRYCYGTLSTINSADASAAASRVADGASSELRRDLEHYNRFFSGNASPAATATKDPYLRSASGEVVKSYDQVCDLLVNWHIQQVVIPSLVEEQAPFDPLDEAQVDLTGIVNARGS